MLHISLCIMNVLVNVLNSDQSLNLLFRFQSLDFLIVPTQVYVIFICMVTCIPSVIVFINTVHVIHSSYFFMYLHVEGCRDLKPSPW